jgi:hypothetical protein
MFQASCTLLFETEGGSEANRLRFLAVENQHVGSASALSYLVTTPEAEDRALLVAVLIGASCNTNSRPVIESVTYDDQELVPVASIEGVPCGGNGTFSQQWILTAPSVGQHEVRVTLADDVSSMHSGAMVFGAVDQDDPVRSFASDSGTGDTSSLSVESAEGDLVVNVVGQGTSIRDTDIGATRRFRNNVDSGNTLNNSAGSTSPGAPEVVSAWTFGGSDEWQSISVSLRPSS